MKKLCNLLGAFLSAALLAACAGSSTLTPNVGTPLSPLTAGATAERTRPSVTHDVLYSFKGYPDDGAEPYAGLINVEGTLYGTTSGGGAYTNGGGFGYGTVFSITTSGKETVLHSFGRRRDGKQPLAGLVNVNDTLYGTTYNGGAKRRGTVFSITASGKEAVLHSFGSSSEDGTYPAAALLNVKGTLYGTAENGGTSNNGTVFSITTSGKETVLHSFESTGDGQDPDAGLVDVNGKLYGTTLGGGTNSAGTVFSITTVGKETVLHSFGARRDGKNPSAALLNVNGKLYGTTAKGGANKDGTVFSITPSGKETVLHSFASGSGDGTYPAAALLNVKGMLYGTTSLGGAYNGGTVFAITTSGKETVLHSFGRRKHGANDPCAGLLDLNGTLYGTTVIGGTSTIGTVFATSP